MPETCYMCKNISTSKEHAPPKCLFPEKKDLPASVDLRKQLITVPSCAEHNTTKSKDDEYLLYCLVMSIPANSVATNQFITKIKRAYERNPKLINQFFIKHKNVLVENKDTLEINETIAVQIDNERFDSCLEKLIRALYFHHFNTKWLGEINLYPNFLLSMDENAKERNKKIENMDMKSNELFSKEESHGVNPDVFKYNVVDGRQICHKFMRLYFYGGNRVTVILGTNG